MIRHLHRALRAVALAALLVAVAWVLCAAPVRADGGVPIPAPAGTTWSVVAGYNTDSHSVHDDNDPHAIDLVRVPRETTSYTPVLSPIDGTVRWRAWDCLMITDAAGFEHLLCHVSPLGQLQRGSAVSVGEQVAVVCPEFECNNYGLAHIHYAIHHSRGGGILGPSIPFTNNYALEGHDLPWTDEYNLHYGREFVSTNAPGWTAPPDSNSAPDPPPAETSPPPEEETPAIEAPVGGWRMVGVPSETTVAAHFQSLNAPIVAFYLWHADIQHFERYHPAASSAAFVGQRWLPAGSAVWAELAEDGAWLPPLATPGARVEIALAPGRNLVSWQRRTASAAEALGSIAGLSHAYRWDAVTETWLIWVPGAPLDSLGTLEPGDAVWVVVDVPGVWIQS